MKPLSNLKSLRVLMLGKNYIQEVCGLRDMAKLDVLDIHANRLRSVEGIAHLDSLRVLNLAGNFITRVVFGLKTFFFSYFQLFENFCLNLLFNLHSSRSGRYGKFNRAQLTTE